MIDILLSTYNGEKYLREQLDSFTGQTEKEWQVVMRDDGSTDSTREIFGEYMKRDKRFRMYEGKRVNVGALRSFELLLEGSEAEHIMFADHDDKWLPEKVEHTLEAMRKAEEEYGKETPIVVFGDLTVADEDLKTRDRSFWHYTGICPDLATKDFVTLAGSPCVTGCTMMINKAAKAVSLPFGKHAMMHDHWIALRVTDCGGRLVKNEHNDILYRQHGRNVIGAWKEASGIELLRYRLTHAVLILRQNIQYLKQARDIRYVGLAEYVSKKAAYKRHKNG